jgi:hypothetical protein
MIYDTNAVNSVFICKNCEANIEIPKSLPCGEAICSHCESNIQINENKFECPLCRNKHDMPRDGLPICKPLLQMLSIKPVKVSRGKAFDSLEILLDKIQNKCNVIAHIFLHAIISRVRVIIAFFIRLKACYSMPTYCT